VRWPWSRHESPPFSDAEYWERRAKLAEQRKHGVEYYRNEAEEAKRQKIALGRVIVEMREGRTIAHLERLLHKRNRQLRSLRDENQRLREAIDAAMIATDTPTGAE
jgi:hypothetical protein